MLHPTGRGADLGRAAVGRLQEPVSTAGDHGVARPSQLGTDGTHEGVVRMLRLVLS